jgi:hypothetical protein
MPKIKKYIIYLVSCFSLIILTIGSLFTAIQISNQKQNNQFCDRIEEVNLLIKNGENKTAKKMLYDTQDNLKSFFWNRDGISNKKALVTLMLKKLGDPISKDSVKDYVSKAENYQKFSLVKECLLRILFLEKNSYDKMQSFRWKHGMQRMHILTTLRADLRHKNILSKQNFDFYLKNLGLFIPKADLETIFIIMAAS